MSFNFWFNVFKCRPTKDFINDLHCYCEYKNDPLNLGGDVWSFLRHIKNTHSYQFEKICDLNEIWGMYRVEFKDKLEDNST